MDDIYLSEICEIFHHAALNDGISITGISERTGISREVIRNILLYFYEFPFGGIGINCSGLPGNIDISQIDEDVLDESVRWNVEIKDMDKIPVENLDGHEKYVLSILLDRAVRDNKDMLLLNEATSKISITTKGVCGRTADVFKLNQWMIKVKFQLDFSRPFSSRPSGIGTACIGWTY
jgi:hypothetical protein